MVLNGGFQNWLLLVPLLRTLQLCQYLEIVLKLPTIAYRRIRGEMIATYKIINVKYDPEASSFLKLLSRSSLEFCIAGEIDLQLGF
jgi:hypothetical protein